MKGIPMCTVLAHATYLGIKTETRRLAAPEACELASTYRGPVADFLDNQLRVWPFAKQQGLAQLAPYQLGQKYYLKENWTLPAMWDTFKGSEIDPKRVEGEIHYGYERDPKKRLPGDGRCRVARFMPLWATRAVVLVTQVFLESLQDISEEEAIAEGIRAFPKVCPASGRPNGNTYHWRPDALAKERFPDPILAFSALWEELHGADSWSANPRVWRIKFTKCPSVDLSEYLGGRK